MSNADRRHAWGANILLLCVTLLVGVVIAEGALRLLGVEYPIFLQVDPDTGFSLRPNVAGWNRSEGVAFMRVNRFGMRDDDHTLEKPADTLRIAVLGDSFTEARQVDLDETFVRVMQDALGSCSAFEGKKIEALNFGVSGYGTAQELVQLRTRVWQFQPDIVVLAFTTSNDVLNNALSLSVAKDRPYFVVGSGGVLIADNEFRDAPFYKGQRRLSTRALLWTLQHSRVAQLVNYARKAATSGIAQPEVPGTEQGIYAEVYQPPANDAWRDAWDVTERLIATMGDEVRAHGVSFIVMTTTAGIQVHPDAAVREAYMREQKIADIFYPDRRLETALRADGIPTLVLGPAMQQRAAETGAFYHGFPNTIDGFGHWNEAGHRFAGERLATFVCEHTP